jgi:hypothetical protein
MRGFPLRTVQCVALSPAKDRVNHDAAMRPLTVRRLVVTPPSAAVTYVNIGPRAGFVRRRLSACVLGRPVAAMTVYVAFLLVASATLRNIALIEDGGV